MSFVLEIDPNAEAAYDEAQSSGGGGKFPPLPAGSFQGTVVPLKKDGTRVEVAEWGGTGPNSKKKVLRVAIKIVADSPTGANRVFFVRIPMFTRFAPTDKHPQGAPAKALFDFWGALGVSKDEILANKLPDVNFMMGKPIGITLSEPVEPDEYNPLGRSEVAFYNKPGDISRTPRRTPGQAVAPWLTPDDELILDYPFASDKARAYIANLKGFPAAAPSAGAPATPAPSWATTPGGAAPAAPAPSWAQPASEPSAIQQAAAASGKGF